MTTFTNAQLWGGYVAGIMEGGGSMGSSSMGWSSVESDYMLGSGGNWSDGSTTPYGGGLGLLQITSNASAFLNACVAAGVSLPAYDTSDPGAQNSLYTAIKAGQAPSSVDTSSANGCYTAYTTKWLQSWIGSAAAITIQKKFNHDYYFVTNAYTTSAIAANISDPQVQIFLYRIEDYSPGAALGMATAPVPTTLAEAVSQAESWGVPFATKLATLVESIPNVNTAPPVNVFDGANDTSSSTPTATGAGTSGGASTSSASNTGVDSSGNLSITPGEQFFTINGSYMQNMNGKPLITFLRNKNIYTATTPKPAPAQGTSGQPTAPSNSQTQAQPGASRSGLDLSWLASTIGSSQGGTAQCYGLAIAWAEHNGYPVLNTSTATGTNPYGTTPGYSAVSIPWDYSWGSGRFPNAEKIVAPRPITYQMVAPGDIVCFQQGAGVYTSDGHVGVMGAGGLFYQQNWESPQAFNPSTGNYGVTTAQSLQSMLASGCVISGLVRFL